MSSEQKTTTFGSGIIIADKIEIKFSKGNFYIDNSDTNNNQRACITAIQDINKDDLRKLSQPFGKVYLDQPLFISNIPLKQFSIFLITSSIHQNHIDTVISPKNKYIEKIFKLDVTKLIHNYNFRLN